MSDAVGKNLTLLGTGGYVIIGTIVVLLAAGIAISLMASGRYALLERALARGTDLEMPFRQRVLSLIMHDAYEALRRNPRQLNTQAIVEHGFQVEASGLLLAERFVKSLTGLMIILGLVGTFYGLTSSIAKLVHLVSGDVNGVADVTESVVRGLTEALSGMSVAFSSSLFGIGSAIVMTLFGVFFNLADKRTALMIHIEHFVDTVLVPQTAGRSAEMPALDGNAGNATAAAITQKLDQMMAGFGQSVAKLEATVHDFEAALQTFAGNTRDFREFNHHLKDNIQRMSLGFGDLSETLKTTASVLKARDPR